MEEEIRKSKKAAGNHRRPFFFHTPLSKQTPTRSTAADQQI